MMKVGSVACQPCTGLTFSSLVKPAVSSTGAVSPMPRAIASTTAVASPDLAVGRITFHTVRQWLAPSAKDASRSVPGTTRITTSEALVTVGSMTTAMDSAAARPLSGRPRVSTANA